MSGAHIYFNVTVNIGSLVTIIDTIRLYLIQQYPKLYNYKLLKENILDDHPYPVTNKELSYRTLRIDLFGKFKDIKNNNQQDHFINNSDEEYDFHYAKKEFVK